MVGRSSRQRDNLQSARSRGVLVVDDSPDLRELIALELHPLDVNVETVASATEALQLLEEADAPDVIVLDHDMPNMSGAEFCQRLRANVRSASIYILMLTGSADMDPIRSLARGADDYLSKPYDPNMLRASVKTALRVQAHRRVMARRERRRAIAWLASVVAHEINNPLSVALSNQDGLAMLLAQPTPAPTELTEARELVVELEHVLHRLRDAAQRLQKRDSLPTAAAADTNLKTFIDSIQQEMGGLGRELEVVVEKHSHESARFDSVMLSSALVAVARAAMDHCTGLIQVAVHFDNWRVAVVLEMFGAPALDPDFILEPRLSGEDSGVPQYHPALSGIEASFERYGGQVFARPLNGRWRFGLTLPVQAEMTE